MVLVVNTTIFQTLLVAETPFGSNNPIKSFDRGKLSKNVGSLAPHFLSHRFLEVPTVSISPKLCVEAPLDAQHQPQRATDTSLAEKLCREAQCNCPALLVVAIMFLHVDENMEKIGFTNKETKWCIRWG